jgi:HEAT repeat protein
MDLVAGLVFVAGALAALWAASASFRSRVAASEPPATPETLIARAAEANGLTLLEPEGHDPEGPGVIGKKGPFRIALRSIAHPDSGVSLTIGGLGHSTAELALRRHDADRFDPAVESTKVETVDPELAHRVYTCGDERLVRALLTAETRGRLLAPPMEDLVRRLSVVAGELHAEVRAAQLDQLPVVLGRLLDLARALARPESIPERLAYNARRDPLPEVRAANLVLLQREYAVLTAAEDALRDACQDGDASVRLQAAALMGEEGRDALLSVFMSTEASPAEIIRAVALLGESLPKKDALLLLEETLQAMKHVPSEAIAQNGEREEGGEGEETEPGLRHLALALIDVLGRIGGADVVETIAPALQHEDGDLAMAAATALGRAGDPAAERPLIEALDRDAPLLRAAVATALGKVGTVKAVGPLRQAGRFYNVTLQGAARQAIAEIQSRIEGASPGQLALAEHEGGQLSLTDEGQVSLADDEPADSKPDPPSRREEER